MSLTTTFCDKAGFDVFFSELEYAAKILGMDSDSVVDQLIQRTIQMRGETVTSPMNYSNASDVKDAFIKGELFVDVCYLIRFSDRKIGSF